MEMEDKAKRPVATDLSGFSGCGEEPSLGVGCQQVARHYR